MVHEGLLASFNAKPDLLENKQEWKSPTHGGADVRHMLTRCAVLYSLVAVLVISQNGGTPEGVEERARRQHDSILFSTSKIENGIK